MEPKKEEEKKRPSTLDILRKLKSQESRPVPKLDTGQPRSIYIDRAENIKLDIPKPRNLPEQKILAALADVERIEKSMRGDSANFLSLYYDLGKYEQAFLKEVERIESQNFEISKDIMKRVEAKRNQIMSKLNIQKELSNIRKDYG